MDALRDLVTGALMEPPDKRAVAILRAWVSEPMTPFQAFYAACLRSYGVPEGGGVARDET